MPSPLCERTCISVRESYRARFRTKSSMHRGGRLSRKCNITTKCNISYNTKHIKVIINICLLVMSYGVQHIHPTSKMRRGCHKEKEQTAPSSSILFAFQICLALFPTLLVVVVSFRFILSFYLRNPSKPRYVIVIKLRMNIEGEQDLNLRWSLYALSGSFVSWQNLQSWSLYPTTTTWQNLQSWRKLIIFLTWTYHN
jgi:hypothetical protein